mgnify:CR=1 FL=1
MVVPLGVCKSPTREDALDVAQFALEKAARLNQFGGAKIVTTTCSAVPVKSGGDS